MQIKDYLNKLLAVIAESPFVETQKLSFEERPPNAAYITGSITFLDGSVLNFREFIVIKSERATFLKYTYHYSAKDNSLIFRYDNALDPKAKNLSNYPQHKHTSKELVSAQRPSFEEILKEISELLQDVPDLQAIKDRINEPVENYEAYSRKRKAHLNRD
jgi:hypothetical protein